jgi:CRISPR/Cas system-associated exonuclease Cas4 (RecB family)
MQKAEGNTGYWSYSRLTTYQFCSLKYWYRYLSGEEPATVSSNLVLGTGVHYGHQLIYTGMMNGGMPQLKNLLDEITGEILLRQRISPPILFSNGGDIDRLIEEAHLLTTCLYNNVTQEKVVAVDLEENVPLVDNGTLLPKFLKVIYDLIVEGDDGGEIVVDLKTAKSRYTQKIQWDLQPTCYLYARGITGATNARRSFRYDVLLKNKTPKLIQYPTSRCQADFERLISIIKTVDRGVRNGVFMPNRGSYFCSTCEWEKLCRDWRD